MKPVLGEILNDGKDEDGRVLQIPKRAPSTPPPVFPDVVMATVVDLGFGSIMAGLEVLWSDPALDLVRKPEELDQMESFRAVAGEKMERRWVECYMRRKADGFKRGA